MEQLNVFRVRGFENNSSVLPCDPEGANPAVKQSNIECKVVNAAFP